MPRLLAILISAGIVCLCSKPALAVDYGQLMAKKVKDALGDKAVKGFTFATYPLDNFGLATAYSRKVAAYKMDCATWDCIGVTDSLKVSALSDYDKLHLKMDSVEYAEVGKGAPLDLSADESTSVGINAVLPALLKALNISGDYSHSNDLTISLKAESILVRVLRRREMANKLNSPQGHPLEKADWSSGDLVLVYADIVAPSMTLELKTKPQTKIDADVKSATLGKRLGDFVGAGSDLSFNLDNKASGDYKFSVSTPVVLAVMTRRAPRGGVLGGDKAKPWEPVDLGSSNKVLSKSVVLPGLP